MSIGPITQFVDYTEGGDSGTDDPSSIQPVIQGENVAGATTPAAGDGIANRTAQNLRLRTETIRDLLEDTQYLRDADRGGLFIGGPGLVSWGGPSTGGTGIMVLSDNLFLVPGLTPGAAQSAPVAPVASKFGTLTLLKSDSAAGLTVQSMRRSYVGGDKINIQVVAGGSSGTVTAELVKDKPQRTIVLTANAPTLAQVISALNGLFPTDVNDNSQLVQASLAAGASNTDTLLTPQAVQFVAGNFDAESHTLTAANIATFFSSSVNHLDEGDTLCIQYASMNDPLPGPPLGGRRQSIPENGNTVIPVGALFNSRVHPERLINAIPVCKVLNGRLVFITGAQVPSGAVNVDLGGIGAASVSWGGGAPWADGSTNPATDVGTELSKIITDLASESGSSGADKIGTKSTAYSFGTVAAQSLAARLTAFDLAKANLGFPNTFTRQQTINGANDAEAALNASVAASSAYRLWTQMNANSTIVRIYYSAVGGMVLTSNAGWVPGTSKWHADNPAIQSYAFAFDYFNMKLKSQPAAAADWADGAWITNTSESNGSLSAITGIFTGLLSADRVRATSAADPGTGNVGGLQGLFSQFVQTPLIKSDRTATRTLVWQSAGSTGQTFRIYRSLNSVSSFESWELTNNAAWSGSAWVYDTAPTTGGFGVSGPTAWKISFNARQQLLLTTFIPLITYAEKTSIASSWSDSAWDYTGGMDLLNNLTPNTMPANYISPNGLVKGWVDYSYNGTTFTINDKWNVPTVNGPFGALGFTYGVPFATGSCVPSLTIDCPSGSFPSGFSTPPRAALFSSNTTGCIFEIFDGATFKNMGSVVHRGRFHVIGLQ